MHGAYNVKLKLHTSYIYKNLKNRKNAQRLLRSFITLAILTLKNCINYSLRKKITTDNNYDNDFIKDG